LQQRGEEGAQAAARAYHERSKHCVDRFAASLGFMDWQSQPDPFRRYEGAPGIDLPLVADGLRPTFSDILCAGDVAASPLDLRNVAALLELSLGLSAWKEFQDSRWALRCNPSSGNLHPTEGYVIVPDLPGLVAGVYHYLSSEHRIERRCTPASGASAFTWPAGLLVGLSSIHWREAWKYGERAYRYCQHDAGHAIGAVAYAAATLGWTTVMLGEAGDEEIGTLLGLDRPEQAEALDPDDREQPDTLLWVGAPAAWPGGFPTKCLRDCVDMARNGEWLGAPNPLSPKHHRWEAIDAVASACRKPATPNSRRPIAARSAAPPWDVAATDLIRERRSAVAMDGRTGITAEQFYRMLEHLRPECHATPWRALPWEPHIHPVFILHRVEGLPAGLFVFERSDGVHERLRKSMSADFAWRRPDGCPEHLRLHLLMEGNYRDTAAGVSCNQDIAANGCFSLGMLAEFDRGLAQGAWFYPRLFWEAGLVGQSLYLSAVAEGVSATGIGCYFDDEFHELLGIEGGEFQSLYHFTVGAALIDERLQTLPPYAHLPIERSF
jgi:SagB-type dehydrogenase family enzyme